MSDVYAVEENLQLSNGITFFRNEWIIKVPQGSEKAKEIADNEGFSFEGELENHPKVFLLRHPTQQDNQKQENKVLTNSLKNYYPEVLFAHQLTTTMIRQENYNLMNGGLLPGRMVSYTYDGTVPLNGYIPEVFQSKVIDKFFCPASNDPNAVTLYKNIANDPLFKYQWYMHDCRKPGSTEPYDHMNVVRVWTEYGIQGEGVIVQVLDAGFKMNHPDLIDNISYEYSYDFYFDRPIPESVEPDENHGSSVAGVIGMVKDNEICGVGVSPKVTLGAVRVMRDAQPMPDKIISDSFFFKSDEVHIKNCSWSQADEEGKDVSHSGPLFEDALKTITTKGRRGKGVVVLHTAGNKKPFSMCGLNSFANSIYTITVAAIGYNGEVADYSERCAAVMISAYSSGDSESTVRVATVDSVQKCTLTFGGTSAACPMVSGAVALAIQINPNLTPRDVMHLLVLTAEYAPLRRSRMIRDVIRNKAGFIYSPDVGFGVLDVFNLVKKAKTFVRVPPLSTCVEDVITYWDRPARFSHGSGIRITADVKSCNGVPTEINYVEQVQIKISFTYNKRGDVQVKLKSPSGSEIHLLEPRPNDYGQELLEWTFNSLHAWGEKPDGSWIVTVYDSTGKKYYAGDVMRLQLIIHGTKMKPAHYDSLRSYYGWSSEKGSFPSKLLDMLEAANALEPIERRLLGASV
ncbi:hypothetical protein PGB90_002434 [Kerria lacca]